MTAPHPVLSPNPDFALGRDGLSGWNLPERRRASFHNMHRLSRYAKSCRAPQVWQLHPDYDTTIAERCRCAGPDPHARLFGHVRPAR